MPFDSDYHVEQSATGDVTLDKNTDLLTVIIAAPANVTLPLAANCKGDKATKTVLNDVTSVASLSFVAAGSDSIVGVSGSGAGDGAILESDGYATWRIVRGSSGVGATVSEAELALSDNTTSDMQSGVKHGLMPKVTAGTVTASKPVVVDSNKDISAFRNVGMVNLDAGSSGVAGTVDVFPATASKGKLEITKADNTNDDTTTLTVDAHGQVTSVHVPDGGAATSYVVQSTAALALTEADVLDGATAGTQVASKATVVNAQKAVDTLRATGNVSVGGTGVPGAASVETTITKAVTAFADTVAKDVFTVTVPNAAHAAVIEVDCLGVLGAGGAIGAGESTRTVKYQVVLARTAGVNAVATVSSAIGGAAAKVVGANDITSVVVTASAIAGAVGVDNTFTIQVAITRSGAGATNHTGVFTARILNQNATGVTIA